MLINTKLAIFPASGGLGTATLKRLLRIVDPKDIVLVARSPERLAVQAKAGVHVRKADYDDLASLEHAFDEVKVLNLISYASIQEDYRFNAHKAAIDAAIKSGVSHIVYSSLTFGGLPSQKTTVTQVMKAHIKTELYLESLHEANSSFTYSIIRQGIYSESFPIYTAFYSLSAPAQDDTIRIPHDGSGRGISWAKREELGEAIANVLQLIYTSDEAAQPFINTTVLLSGPKEMSLNDTVKVLGDTIGRNIKIQQVSIEEYSRQPQVQEGLSYGGGDWAPLWATAFEGIRLGEAGNVSPTLETLLGRKPEAFEVTIGEMAKGARMEA